MVFGQMQASTYPNYTQSIYLSNYLNTPNGGGGGSISVTNDVLTVSFSGGWSTPQYLKMGTIITLTISPSLPDMELGQILTSSGVYAGFSAKILNNSLVIYMGGSPSAMTNCNFYFTKNLACTSAIWYLDADTDGFGASTPTITSCTQPAGYVANNTDCNDGNTSINPNTKWYLDNELDGLGDPLNFVTQCTKPTGNYVLNNVDNCPLVAGTSANCASLGAISQDQNYIKTTTYKVASTTTIASPTISQANQNITYFDGLGRPIQHIANQQSASGKDIVIPIEYDDFGRQIKEYLPFASNSSTGMTYDPAGITNISNYAPYVGQNPFSEKAFEASPLNRVLKQAAPGTDWKLGNGHEIKLEYQTNTTADAVKLFSVTTSWDVAKGVYDIPTSLTPADYQEFQLYKTITYDENTAATPTESNGSTVEFKNKEGQVILKRTYESSVKHDTYYVYDQYGNLSLVIPPLVNSYASISTALLDDLCYQYKYDSRNRLVEKKLPGKQWEFIVYDKLDRVVATGPAFSPFSDITTIGWLITKYDAYSRVAYTGWENTTATSSTRTTKQTAQNGLTTSLNEYKSAPGVIDGVGTFYTNSVAPTALKILTVNFYDDYNFSNAPSFPAYSYNGVASFYNNTTMKPKGMSTGSWVRVLTTASSTVGETLYVLYDYKARPIRNYTVNHLGGFTRTDIDLDFSGKTTHTYTTHKRISTDVQISINEYFTYSSQDRLLTHTHQVNSLPVQLLASNTYDELGQLISKNVGNTIAAPLQKVDYAYNIRGWLTEINKVAALQQGSDPKDLFGFKINYNTIDGDASVSNKLYNGNIAETSWSTSPIVRTYGYKYDNLNRLKNATYYKIASLPYISKSYNENLSYDKNGNIQFLTRNGDIDDALPPNGIDDLVYTYTPNTNKLQNVIDNTNNTSGFNDGNKSSVDYTYDLNGNLKTDANKNITDIVYNHLNLPTKITFGTTGRIEYIYDALGQKVKKQVFTTSQGSIPIISDYLSGFQYIFHENYSGYTYNLQYFPTAEGYVKNTGGVYSYVFNYTDHLGNIRLSYGLNANVLTIFEENNYYPFGLKQKGYNSNNLQAGYKYKYNGKELQDELGLNWYSYGYRHYDPAIARWTTMDPLLNDLDFKFDPNEIDDDDDDEVALAMKTTLGNGGGIFNTDNLNPYSYGYNDPVRFDDPDGRCPICIYVVAALLYSEFANAPTGDAKTDSRNYNDSKSNKALVSGAVLAGGTRTIARSVLSNSAKDKAVDKVSEKTKEKVTESPKRTSSQDNKPSKVEKSKTTEKVGDKFTKKTEVRPSKERPGQSRAEYVSVKNKDGKTIRTYKDSYDRANKFQGRKPLRGGPEGRSQ
jgi:RHS repeat-associated protein